jgi:Ca2+:H+ antiporter
LVRPWLAPRTLLPIAALAAAIGISVEGLSVEDWPVWAAALVSGLVILLLFGTVFVVLHHAELVAEALGEPFGTLLLTLAVTIIEASLIVSMMLHGANNPTLARESVFSTVMIVTTGVIGLCLFVGGLRHHTQDVRREGTNAFLAVLIALTILTLVLPDYTLTTSPGTFSSLQLAFVAFLSVLLYGAFLFAQTVRHQDDFVEERPYGGAGMHAQPGRRQTIVSLVLLVIGLAGIVLLAEEIAGAIEDGLEALHVHQADAIIGTFIATLVLMPEAAAAIRAAFRNELQRSVNIALGSACATIGLTIPAVSAVSLMTGRELTFGLDADDIVMLVLALSISIVGFGTGRTTVLTGLVHLVVFVAFVLLVAVP